MYPSVLLFKSNHSFTGSHGQAIYPTEKFTSMWFASVVGASHRVTTLCSVLSRHTGYDWNNIPKKYEGKSSNGFHIKWIIGTHGNWKNQNAGSRFGATCKTALPIQTTNGPNGLNWQCFLAGSSKTAPMILIFSIAMGADYSSVLISIVHWVPQFLMHNKSILGGVFSNYVRSTI